MSEQRLRVISLPDLERIGLHFPTHYAEAVLLLTDAEAKDLVKAIELARMYLLAQEACTIDLVPGEEPACSSNTVSPLR